MKRKTKKLTLGKETLRGLEARTVEDHELRRVAGGAAVSFNSCRGGLIAGCLAQVE